MLKQIRAGILAAALLAAQAPQPVFAQSGQHYLVLSANDVPGMSDNGGRLNLRIDNTRSLALSNGERIMLFRVAELLPGSVFADTGLAPGDEIFALNGYQFRDGESYTGYVHSLSGSRPVLDYVEHGSGRLMRVLAPYTPPRPYAGGNSPTPPATPRAGSSDNTAVIAGLVVIGAGVVCWLTSCLSGEGQSNTASRSNSGGSASSPRFDPAPSARYGYQQEAPEQPSVQGNVHGNLPTDIHGNVPSDIHGNPL